MKWLDSLNLSDRDRRRMVIATRIGAPVVLVVLGALVAAVLIRTGPTASMIDELRSAPQVQVFAAQPVPVRRQWAGFGIVQADRVADVPARVTATVLEVPEGIDPGVTVERGQLLLRLDPSDFEQRLDSAEQNLAQIAAQLRQLEVEEASFRERLVLEQRDVELAEAELSRLRQLLARGAANQQDVDRSHRSLIDAQRRRSLVTEAVERIPPRRGQLQAQQLAQRSALRLAQQDLERSSIRSPISGVLQSVDVERGENVTAGQRVARVVDPAIVEVPVRLPAAARRHIAIGDEVVLQPSSGEGEACFAVVTRMSPENDASMRTMTAYAKVDQTRFDADARLTPGGFVTASVTSGEATPRWVVPRRSVRAGRVLLVDDGVVRSVPVTVAFALEGRITSLGLPDEQWAVLENFPGQPGQLVLVNASQSVLDGERVVPVLPAPEIAQNAGPDGEEEAAARSGPIHPPSAFGPAPAPGGGP